MSEDDARKEAINNAAKALHESYFGPGTWATYGSDARGHARRALRRALMSLTNQGYDLVPIRGEPPVGETRPEARPGH